MTTHDAKVVWVTVPGKSRPFLPSKERYIGIGRFPEDGPTWPDGAWSVVLQFDQPPAEQAEGPMLAKVRFLVEEGPHERLQPGVRFSVHQALTKVAEVEVIG